MMKNKYNRKKILTEAGFTEDYAEKFLVYFDVYMSTFIESWDAEEFRLLFLPELEQLQIKQGRNNGNESIPQ